MPGYQEYNGDTWTSADPKSVNWNFTKPLNKEGLDIRIQNNLDVSVSVSVEITDQRDENFNRTKQLTFWSEGLVGPLYEREQGSMSDNGTSASISAGSHESFRLTTLWPRIRFTIDPSATPSSGSLKLIQTVALT